MTIYLKYNEILENGEQLLKITEDYTNMINNITNISKAINEEWISENKDIALNNLNDLIKNLNINKNYYALFANIIKSVHKNFLLTEHDATKYMILENINEVKNG